METSSEEPKYEAYLPKGKAIIYFNPDSNWIYDVYFQESVAGHQIIILPEKMILAKEPKTIEDIQNNPYSILLGKNSMEFWIAAVEKNPLLLNFSPMVAGNEEFTVNFMIEFSKLGNAYFLLYQCGFKLQHLNEKVFKIIINWIEPDIYYLKKSTTPYLVKKVFYKTVNNISAADLCNDHYEVVASESLSSNRIELVRTILGRFPEFIDRGLNLGYVEIQKFLTKCRNELNLEIIQVPEDVKLVVSNLVLLNDSTGRNSTDILASVYSLSSTQMLPQVFEYLVDRGHIPESMVPLEFIATDKKLKLQKLLKIFLETCSEDSK